MSFRQITFVILASMCASSCVTAQSSKSDEKSSCSNVYIINPVSLWRLRIPTWKFRRQWTANRLCCAASSLNKIGERSLLVEAF